MNQTDGFISDELSEILIEPIQKEEQDSEWNLSFLIQIPTFIEDRL